MGHHKVHFAAEHGAELVEHVEPALQRRAIALEHHEDIDIAVGAEVVAEDGTEG